MTQNMEPIGPSSTSAGPVVGADRISSLDAIRGVAILGILPMNALSFGLDPAAYLNVSADGIRQPLDWVVGLLTMLVADQKMMALFSLLFGVGVAVFADRAEAKGRPVISLSLWRFGLLFAIGLAHAAVWDGDVLTLYAMCAPLVLLARHVQPRFLMVAGALIAVAGTAAAPLVQARVGSDGVELGNVWNPDLADEFELFDTWDVFNGFGRALGLMLIGVGLYRLGIVQGGRSDDFYRRLATWGIGFGGGVTAAGLAFRMIDRWSVDHALTGYMPTGFGMIPLALGIMAVVILWNRQGTPAVIRFRNLGRMALTNYLTQTIIGVVTLDWMTGEADLSRTVIAVWILAVWALQLWWSTWWLERFRFGPVEWAWRSATYRTRQPLRR